MVSTSLSVYIFTHLPFCQRRSVTHDALRTTPPTVRNLTVVRATAAAAECIQPRRKIFATRRRNSEHRGARLCMAAGRPMARQSGYSKYTQGVQTLALNLEVEVDIVVQHCQRSQVHRRPLMQGCFLRTNKAVLREHGTPMSRMA